MICSTLVTLIDPNGIRTNYWYNQATMTYTNAKGESIDAYTAGSMGYTICRTEEAKETIDSFLELSNSEMKKNYREMIGKDRQIEREEHDGSAEMDYETLARAAETADSLRLNKFKTSDLLNLNAQYLSTVSGMSAAAAALEQISGGIQIGVERRWKRTSEASHGEKYIAHYSILPVADFRAVGDAIKFVKLLRSAHPQLSHIGYTKLAYTKLALNDRETEVKFVKEWNSPFTEDVLINIMLEKGYNMSISCPNQMLLLGELSNYSGIPEISRIEMFVDYCRRTAPKRE
ncbi:hypothetical protein Aes012_055 [Aeromonas phage Aes012]|uniref:Putative phage protein n=1 Tax=Aeromonas phage Aes012 TaxID=1198014 RepID=I6ZV59_9CAUD|nr:hypothetical protein Aes012_055 [Aeromonas phage Aes012]AFN69685.1 putative phage protein [Aeromonas phage Aes012]